MSDSSILGYSLNQRKFTRGNALSYQGVHPCIVKKRVVHNKSRNNSSRSQYHLELETKSRQYQGIFYLDGNDYDKARVGQEFKSYSIITSRDGTVRLSKELTEEEAMRDVIKSARIIFVQSILVVLFLGFPTILYLAKTISKFFH